MSDREKQTFKNPEADVHHALALWAAACAEHTLYLFEESSPSDARPRRALAAVRSWVHGELAMVKCREAAFAAHTAAREASAPAAVAAARAAGQAAAVAHMWNHAPHAAAYAAKAASLAVRHDQASAAKAAARDWQWMHLREDLHPLGFPNGK